MFCFTGKPGPNLISLRNIGICGIIPYANQLEAIKTLMVNKIPYRASSDLFSGIKDHSSTKLPVPDTTA